MVVRAVPLDFGEDEEGKQANGGFDPDALDWGDDYGEGEEEEAEFQSTPSASAGEPGRPQWVSNLGNITRNVTANAVRGASGLADQAKQGIGKLEAGRKIENATQKLQKGAEQIITSDAAAHVTKGTVNLGKSIGKFFGNTVQAVRNMGHGEDQGAQGVALETLTRLHQSLHTPFEDGNGDHGVLVVKIWHVFFGEQVKFTRKSPKWKELGFTSNDPMVDSQDGKPHRSGILGLRCLGYFAVNYTAKAQAMAMAQRRNVMTTYPFGTVAFNLAMMLACVLHFDAKQHPKCNEVTAPYWHLFDDGDDAFMELFVVAFTFLDTNWVSTKATRKEFPQIMAATRTAVESLLARAPSNISELMAYAADL